MTDDTTRFQKLLAEVRAGSQDAARELAETYGPHVQRCVRRSLHQRLRSRFDSLDFVQLMWLSIFRDRDQLPDLVQPEQLINYLAGIARHKVLDAGRRRFTARDDVRREVEIDEIVDDSADPATHPISRDPTPSAAAAVRDEWNFLTDRAPTRVRQVLRLRSEGNTFREIAERLSIDESTARKIVRRLQDEVQAEESPTVQSDSVVEGQR